MEASASLIALFRAAWGAKAQSARPGGKHPKEKRKSVPQSPAAVHLDLSATRVTSEGCQSANQSEGRGGGGMLAGRGGRHHS